MMSVGVIMTTGVDVIMSTDTAANRTLLPCRTPNRLPGDRCLGKNRRAIAGRNDQFR